MIFVGIDPGKSGALASIGANGDWLEVHDTITLSSGRGAKREYDVASMKELLQDVTRGGEVRAVIERQQAMPGQGVSSMFSVGHGYGIWLGLLAGLEIPHEVVQARLWQRALGVRPKSGKAGSALVASRLWPDAPIRGPKGGLKDGRCDALCIAEWGRRQNTASEAGGCP